MSKNIKYIDADAHLDKMFSTIDSFGDYLKQATYRGEPLTIAGVKTLLKESFRNAPAADVVEVVRCKDCKHYNAYGHTSIWLNGRFEKAGWCNRRIEFDEEFRMGPDDFCNYGEKMDKEG